MLVGSAAAEARTSRTTADRIGLLLLLQEMNTERDYTVMGSADNVPKSQGPVRVGLIAEGQSLVRLAPAVDACVLLQPVGQSGRPTGAGLPDVPWFDDPRVLIAHQGLEAVLLASSLRDDVELAAVAAERGLHVWRLPPLARTFEQGTGVLTRIKSLPVVYRVASWWEYVADHVWQELPWPEDFRPLFSELRISAPGPASESWQTRLAESAGGVLADQGYPMLEALVAVRGLPDGVVGDIGSYRKGAGGAARETEDAAVAILHYADRGLALVRAAWDLPPSERQMAHHGQAVSAVLDDEEVSLLDAAGAVIERRPLPGEFLANELARFAELVRSRARDRAAATLQRHLAVSALLEAVYLSARTGHPESPRKLYELQAWPEPRL
jgi:hypothetical protein